MGIKRLLSIVGALMFIALATTVGSLALQASLGRSPAVALGASIVAAIAAAAFAARGLKHV